MSEHEAYKFLLLGGTNFQYGRLSLCDLTNFMYSQITNNRRFQVHCDDPRNNFSKIYEDPDSAITKFLELKKKTKRIL